MLAVAIAAIGLDSALLGLIVPLLPEIEERTGAGDSQLGLAMAAYAIPILFVSLPLGRLADSLGRRPLLLGGLLLTAAGSALIAASSALEPLLAGRAIQGVGSAASWIAALALVSDLAPPGRKGEAIGFALAANSVGAIGGPALGGLTGHAVGFEFPFLLVAGLAGACLLAGAVVLPGRRPEPEVADLETAPAPAGRTPAPRDRGTSSRRALVSAVSRAALPAMLVVVCGAGALALVDVVVPLDADRRLGLSAAAIGGLFAATLTLDAIAAPLAGRAGDRRGRTPVAIAGLAGVAVSFVLLASLPGTWGLGAGLALFGVAISSTFAASVPWLDEAFGALQRGLGYGFLNVVYSIGYTVGPLVAGVAMDFSGPDLAYGLATAAILIAASLLVWRASREGEPPVEHPQLEARPSLPPH